MTQKTAPKILNEIIDGLTQAIGACSVLIHAQRNPKWMMFRQALELMKEGLQRQGTMPLTKNTIITGPQ